MADHIFQKWFLLKADHKDPGVRKLEKFHKTVHCADPQIYGVGLVPVDEIAFIEHQIVMCDFGVQGKKMPGSIEIGTDRLVRFSIPEQPRFELGEFLTGRFRKTVCGKSSFSHSIIIPFCF